MSCQPPGRWAPGRQHRAEPHRRHRAGGARPGFAGSCISLGRRAGTFQFARKDDTAVNFYFSGRLAPRSRRRSARARCGGCAARPASPARRSGSRAARVPSSRRSLRGGHGIVTTGPPPDEHAERFTYLRPLLFTIAYEILGSATESDDVLQDSYLRWADVDLATVRDTKSYLAQLVTRQALNALRAGARRREDYVGPWLPEPLLLDDLRRLGRRRARRIGLDGDAGAARDAHAPTSGRYSSCVRRSASTTTNRRSGRQIRGGRAPAGAPRPRARARAAQTVRPVDAERTAQITEQFLTAATTGDMDGPAVAARAGRHLDRRPAAARPPRPRPLVGAREGGRVMRASSASARACRHPVRDGDCNSAPAVVVYDDDHLEGVFVFEIDRRPDHQLLRHAQSREAGRHPDPADHQPLVTSTTSARQQRRVVGGVSRPDRLSPTPPPGVG